MKKIFTLLVSVTLFASAFAQYDRGNNKEDAYNRKDVVFSDGRNNNDGYRHNDDHLYNDNYSFGKRRIEMQIMQINREYDFKIRDIRSRMFMSPFKKERIICMLEEQRKFEIKKVYSQNDGRRDHYDDHDSKRGW